MPSWLVTESYLWIQALVAALLRLKISLDGVVYNSVHHGHGLCFALFEPKEPNLEDLSQAKLAYSEVDAALVAESLYTVNKQKLTMQEVFVYVLGGKIVPTV